MYLNDGQAETEMGARSILAQQPQINKFFYSQLTQLSNLVAAATLKVDEHISKTTEVSVFYQHAGGYVKAITDRALHAHSDTVKTSRLRKYAVVFGVIWFISLSIAIVALVQGFSILGGMSLLCLCGSAYVFLACLKTQPAIVHAAPLAEKIFSDFNREAIRIRAHRVMLLASVSAALSRDVCALTQGGDTSVGMQSASLRQLESVLLYLQQREREIDLALREEQHPVSVLFVQAQAAIQAIHDATACYIRLRCLTDVPQWLPTRLGEFAVTLSNATQELSTHLPHVSIVAPE